MSIAKRIAFIWLGFVALMLVSLFFPRHEISPAAFIINVLQILLLVVSLYLVRSEAHHNTRWIFVNFSFMFGVGILFHFYNFVGTLVFQNQPMARHYYFQYISQALYFFLFSFAITYVTVDLLFRDFRVVQKYLVTLAVVGGFFGYHYYPYFSNPDFLYTTHEIQEWRELDRIAAAHKQEFGEEGSDFQLAGLAAGVEDGILQKIPFGERMERIQALRPYLEGQNYIILLFKPIYVNSIFMGTLCVGMILLFFGHLYRKDPPQGAYIEKMMFLFLVFCTLEIFHSWTLIKTLEWSAFSQLTGIGLYLSALVLACIAFVFAFRLRFITSVKGEFYENEIVVSPSQVTRWRDALDNMVIAHFFNRREIFGRLFVAKYKN